MVGSLVGDIAKSYMRMRQCDVIYRGGQRSIAGQWPSHQVDVQWKCMEAQMRINLRWREHLKLFYVLQFYAVNVSF